MGKLLVVLRLPCGGLADPNRRDDSREDPRAAPLHRSEGSSLDAIRAAENETRVQKNPTSREKVKTEQRGFFS